MVIEFINFQDRKILFEMRETENKALDALLKSKCSGGSGNSNAIILRPSAQRVMKMQCALEDTLSIDSVKLRISKRNNGFTSGPANIKVNINYFRVVKKCHSYR